VSLSVFCRILKYTFFTHTDVFYSSQNEDGELAALRTPPDEGAHDSPFNVSEIPTQLEITDGHTQDEVQSAIWKQLNAGEKDYVQKFNTSRVKSVKLSELRHLRDNDRTKAAFSLLRDRRKLVIDQEYMVDIGDPNLVFRSGPHFLDYTLYIGSRCGLDAALPNVDNDHNWTAKLDLNMMSRLWPDSNINCLPFNPQGRMAYIGTRLDDQLWLSLVPHTFFDPDHPENSKDNFPAMRAPTTALSASHANMMIMFIAHVLAGLRHHDIHCHPTYPQPLTRDSVKEATEIL
jgi:hypothetical protein